MAYFVGIDLGGTNIKTGIMDSDAKVIAKASRPTDAERGPDAVLRSMADAALDLIKDAGFSKDDIKAIGVGSPGPINFEKGTIVNAPNLKGWSNTPVCKTIEELTGIKTYLENDANAAALGEFWAGAGQSKVVKNLVMLTLGTGIGSGIIIDGKMLRGAHGMGGEGGHIIVEAGGRLCGCEQRGCIEAYASASSCGRIAEEKLGEYPGSSLVGVFERNGAITSKDVFDAAKAGDIFGLRMAQDTADYLAAACLTFARLFDPQMIVFAGGMIFAGDFLFDMIRESVEKGNWKVAPVQMEIVAAELGNDAGFIGAAATAWNESK